MHKANYKLYQIEVIKHNSDSLTVKATNRFGKVFYAFIKREERYWIGGSDFGLIEYKTMKGILWEFSLSLLRECREYDKRWYDFNCMTKVEEDGNKPLTWEETDRGSNRFEEEEPTFRGGVKFYTERY
jgi:hypothetical protein